LTSAIKFWFFPSGGLFFMMTPWIAPDQTLLLLVVILLTVCLGIVSELKNWFRGALAGVMVTMLLMILLVTVGVVPSAAKGGVPVYGFVFDYVLPLALPMLLFNANLRQILRGTGRLLLVYLLGTVTVVIGGVVAYFVVSLGPEAYKIAGVFIATFVGGSVNFMASAETLEFLNSTLFAPTIAVDGFVGNLFMLVLFALPGFRWLQRRFPAYKDSQSAGKGGNTPMLVGNSSGELLEQVGVVLLLSSAVVAAGAGLNQFLQNALGLTFNVTLLLATLLTVALANLFPKWLQRYQQTAFALGIFLMYIFLAVIGAATQVRDIMTEGPGILLFCLLTLGIHLGLLLLLGRWAKFSVVEIAVASVANVGGPAVVPPMALTGKAQSLITPGILVGILGYVIGTLIGISVGFALP